MQKLYQKLGLIGLDDIKTVVKGFTATPSGQNPTIDIQRYLDGHSDCWQAHLIYETKNIKKKKIVINASAFLPYFNLSYELTNGIKNIFAHLLQDGFEIYYSRDNEILNVTKDTHWFQVFNELRPIAKSDLEKILMTKDMSKNVIIINNTQLIALVNQLACKVCKDYKDYKDYKDNEDQFNSFNAMSLSHHLIAADYENLLNILESDERISLSLFEQDIDKVPDILKYVYEIEIHSIQQNFNLIKRCPQLRSLVIRNGELMKNQLLNINPQAFIHVEKIVFLDTSFEKETLSQLINSCPQLNSLKFIDCRYKDHQIINIGNNTCQNLEELEIISSTLHLGELINIINQSLKLKKLTLNYRRVERIPADWVPSLKLLDNSFVTDACQKVEKLNIIADNLSLINSLTNYMHWSQDIERLILACSNLKSLKLALISGIDIPFMLLINRTLQLVELKVTQNISQINLHILLHANPYLKKLKMYQGIHRCSTSPSTQSDNLLIENLNKKDTWFSNIEELIICPEDSFIEYWRYLINRCNNIKKISVEPFDDEYIIKLDLHKHLKHHLQNANFVHRTAEEINNFLGENTHLKSFILHARLGLNINILIHIEILQIQDADLGQIISILKVCQRLKTLIFYECILFDTDNQINDQLVFEKVEKLVIERSRLSVPSLLFFLGAFTQLKYLQIMPLVFPDKSNDRIILSELACKKLEYLSLEVLGLPVAVEREILKASPRLIKYYNTQELDLTNSIMIITHLNSCLLVNLDIDLNFFTPPILRLLMQKCPHLKRLKIANCEVKDFQTICDNEIYPQLHTLILEESLISTEELSALIEKFPGLACIEIPINKRMSYVEIIDLPERYPHIKFNQDDWHDPAWDPDIKFYQEDLHENNGGNDNNNEINEDGDNNNENNNEVVIKRTSSSSATTSTLDGSVANKKTKYIVDELFLSRHPQYQPQPSQYKLQTYALNKNEADEFIFEYLPPQEKNLITVPYPIIRGLSPAKIKDLYLQHTDYAANNIIYGQFRYSKIVAGKWYTLPGLSDEDYILALSDDAQLIEIRYETEINYYTICFNSVPYPQPYEVGFIISFSELLPKVSANISPSQNDYFIRQIRFDNQCNVFQNDMYVKMLLSLTFTERLDALVRYCQTFSVGEHDINEKGAKKINRLISLKWGACEHRAKLFLILASILDIPAKLDRNQVHDVVKVWNGQSWQRINLGGYPATVEIKPLDNNAATSSLQKYTESLIPSSIHNKQNPIKPAHIRIRPWESLHLIADNYLDYITAILKVFAKRILLIVNNTEDVELLFFSCLSQKSDEKIFFISNLDDISFYHYQIQADGKYEKKESPLLHFIQSAQTHSQQTLFINYTELKAHQSGYSNIFNHQQRMLGNVILPTQLKIVVIVEKCALHKLWNLFMGNTDGVTTCPDNFPKVNIADELREIMKFTPDKSHFAYEYINDDDTWYKKLIGHNGIKGRTFTVTSGALLRAIEEKQSGLILYDAPFHLPEFRKFMLELLNYKKFYFNGQYYHLPAQFSIQHANPNYTFSKMHQCTKEAQFIAPLNTMTFQYFFKHQALTATGFEPKLGWIAENYDKKLTIFVEDKFSLGQWNQLITESNQFHCELNFLATHHDMVPSEIQEHFSVQTIKLLIPSPQLKVIITNDVDFVCQEFTEANIIPISANHRVEDVLFRMNLVNKEFIAEETDILKIIRDLKPNDTLILKGQFQCDLIKALSTLFFDPMYLYVNGNTIQIKGNIIFVSSDSKPFANISFQQRDYALQDYWNYLKQTAIPFSSLSNLQHFYQKYNVKPKLSHFKQCPTDLALINQWQNDLISQLQLSLDQSYRTPNQTLESSVDETSPAEILELFKYKTLLYLLGETGVGKSYFIQNTLKEYAKSQGILIQVFNDHEELEKWTTSDPGAGYSILFFDEKNLSLDDLAEIENLLQGKPEVWIRGKCYKLTTTENPNKHKHLKVVCAGNFWHYQDRVKMDLAERYPCYIEFKAPALEKTFMPLLRSLPHNTIDADDFDKIQNIFIKFYQQAKKIDINITPRNLQLMALRFLAHYHSFRLLKLNIDVIFLAYYAAHTEIKILLKAAKSTNELIKQQRDCWKQNSTSYDTHKFSLKILLSKGLFSRKNSEFIYTKSREKIHYLIQDFLAIRKYKILNAQLNLQAYGINGLILEGNAATGKKSIIKTVLTEQNIPHHFISVADISDMENVLINAFHEGALVVFPRLKQFSYEKLLNTLLSGTDKAGNPAKKPGFTVISTQYISGLFSPALENRFLKINLCDYSSEEINQILQEHLHCTRKAAKQFTTDFFESKNYAKFNNLYPQPNLSHLKDHVEKELQLHPEKIRKAQDTEHKTVETNRKTTEALILRPHSKRLAELRPPSPSKKRI